MSILDKQFYGDVNHPEHGNFIKLSRRGCPKCGGRLFQKGAIPVGLVMCESVSSCCMEYEYNGDGGWCIDVDGNAGVKNPRFLPDPMPKYRKRR